MLKSLPCRLLWMTLLFACMSCDNSSSVGTSIDDYGTFKGDYKLILKGGNPLLHQPGSLHLWYAPKSGKRSLVATYIVAGPVVFPDGLVVFSGGLGDDRRWKSAPALLAYSPGGVPVEITEMVTKKYCADQEIEYAPLAGAFYYSYDIERSSKDPPSNEPIQVTGTKLSHWTEDRIHVSFSRDEVDQWIREIRKSGIKKSYDGVDYMIPESSAETAASDQRAAPRGTPASPLDPR